MVNGAVASIGMSVSENDMIEFDGPPVKLEKKHVCYMLHKPVGYITTASDEFGRKTVMDLMKDAKTRVYPAGRLDCDSSGLLIMTNDGMLAYKLTHPGQMVKKTYIASVRGIMTAEAVKRLEDGVIIDGEKTARAGVKVLSAKENISRVRFIIHEGKNRQIRKMCEAVGYTVISLKRVAVGGLSIGDLEKGRYRELTKHETALLLQGGR
jgi:23S rRNA pseudouridine2605 synthase